MRYGGKATDVLSTRPACDLCGKDAVVDGKTRRGPWGYLCPLHFYELGTGLGEGRGQVLLCGDDRDDLLIGEYGLEEDGWEYESGR
jgi:hypothetical protein